MNNYSQKEKEAKRKNPMRLWILPLMGKLMDSASGGLHSSPNRLDPPAADPQYPQYYGYWFFDQKSKPEVSTLVKTGSF